MVNKLKLFWTNLRESLWFVPGLMIAFSIALAFGLIELDSRMDIKWLEDYPRMFGLGADGSRGMLTAIASSMLTVATLAFSLTLNSITQASGQFTPRIMRNFLRDRVNQFVLGYFVSVFAFCLIVLRTIRGGDEIKFVPSISVMVGLVLAVGGIFVLIFFIHHIAASLQITTILDNIVNETKGAVERMFPEKLGAAATGMEKDESRFAENIKTWQKIPALKAGYIQSVDATDLLNFAAENRVLLRMRRGIGQFAGSGATLAEIAPDTETGVRQMKFEAQKIEEINSFFGIDRHRTIEQDAGFGIRQIVDIALKALSPGVNDTTTAVYCIDNLGEILGEIAGRKMPARIRSRNGVPRIIATAPDFADYVETAFDQILVNGEANAAIFERLLATIVFIAERAESDERRAVLARQVEKIAEFAEETLKTGHEREKIRLKTIEAKRSF